MAEKSILIVDDDRDLATVTQDMLINYGYNVRWANDSKTAYDLLSENKFSIILLDINLPCDSGFDFCREIRKSSSVPIIFVSARTSEDDKISGLDIGGDDYISKPYSLKELLSRVNSLLRRTYGFCDDSNFLKIGEIEIYPASRTVKKCENEIPLSLKEFDLLLFLAKNKNKAVKKEILLNELWGMFSDVEQSTVSVHIRWLREKLEAIPSKPAYIKTVWGVGYSLCDDEL